MNKKGSPMSQKSNYFKGQIDYAVVIPVFFFINDWFSLNLCCNDE